MEHSPAFKEAMALLGQEPLPEDAADRLEALEQHIQPNERRMFGDLWEAYLAAADLPPPQSR